MNKFCSLSITFALDDARPIILAHKYVQSVEVALLENIHNIKLNH